MVLRYQAGEATALEVVDAQNTVTLARNAYDDGLARYRIALANLEAGRIGIAAMALMQRSTLVLTTSITAVKQWHREILDERLKDLEADPAAGETWEVVQERLRKKFDSGH
jgi:hypothetical protein